MEVHGVGTRRELFVVSGFPGGEVALGAHQTRSVGLVEGERYSLPHGISWTL